MNHIEQMLEEFTAGTIQPENYTVLRKFTPKDVLTPVADGANIKRLMVIDTETTGMDPEKDKIIELGYLMVRFNVDDGTIYDIEKRHVGFEDPGMPIPELITRITGITDDDVRGRKFNDEEVRADAEKADIVVAHNAGFDRPFLEKRFPCFADRWFACSMKEGPWEAMEIGSTKQEFLAFKVAGMFYDAHRAVVDAEVLLQVMALPGPSGKSIFNDILESSRSNQYRVWANDSPFETKDDLKQAGFRWNDGSGPALPIKAWYADVKESALDETLSFLASNIYTKPARVTVDSMDGFDRYTKRHTEREMRSLGVTRKAPKP